MAKKENVLLGIFASVLLFSMVMMGLQVSQVSQLTGFATTGTTVSNVTISYYLAITMSTNLQDGILFGSVDALPVTDINASHNNDSGAGLSSMFINVSTDSNTALDFCVKANTHMTSGGDNIQLGNESYSNATTTAAGTPASTAQISLTTSNVKTGLNVGRGNSTYYRFWLDIPAAQPSGTYNNTISFEGVRATTECS